MPTHLRILIRACRQWSANGDAQLGAALAYYALFSIAPLLVIATGLAGTVLDEEAARGQVRQRLGDFMDPNSAAAVETFIQYAGPSAGAAWVQALSIGVLVFGALGAFVQLRTSLCHIWGLGPPRGSTSLGMVLDYALALVMVFVVVALLLASLGVGLAVTLARASTGRGFPWEVAEFAISAVFLTILFAFVYYVLSGWRIGWGDVCYGAAAAALLFTVGKVLLGYYLLYAGTAPAYGASGSLVVFLMWVYYSSLSLFLGAELIQARRTRHDWLPGLAERDAASS